MSRYVILRVSTNTSSDYKIQQNCGQSGIIYIRLINRIQPRILCTQQYAVQAATRFTDDFSIAIQIRWKIRFAVGHFVPIRSPQILARTTTAV